MVANIRYRNLKQQVHCIVYHGAIGFIPLVVSNCSNKLARLGHCEHPAADEGHWRILRVGVHMHDVKEFVIGVLTGELVLYVLDEVMME